MSHNYQRDIFITVRRNQDCPDHLVTTLVIRNYRDGELLSTHMRESAAATSVAGVRQKLAYLAKLVRVCDIDRDHPTNASYVPLRMTWDIRLDQPNHANLPSLPNLPS